MAMKRIGAFFHGRVENLGLSYLVRLNDEKGIENLACWIPLVEIKCEVFGKKPQR
jgi:hypothetical protein